MDYNGFQARLKDLKAAEMAALRRGDKEAADRCREKQFSLRHQRTNLQAQLYSFLENEDVNKNAQVEEGYTHLEDNSRVEKEGAEGEESDFQVYNETVLASGASGEESSDESSNESSDEETDGTQGDDGEEEKQIKEEEIRAESSTRSTKKEKGSASEVCENEEVKNSGKRERKPCPVPNCDANVVHLPKHLRNVHKWNAEYARTALKRLKLRKKYVFLSQETAVAGNRRRKKSEEKAKKPERPNRRSKLCPLRGCMVITDRLPQHLQRRHKLKREDPRYKKVLSLAKVFSTDRPHVFMRMKEELRNRQGLIAGDVQLAQISDNSEDEYPLNFQSSDQSEHKRDESDTLPQDDEVAELASSTTRNTPETENKVLKQFCKWMLSPDGEQKDKKTATQHVSQLKRIESVVSGGLASLLDQKVIRDVFLPYAKEKYHPATIKSYLMSLQHYCSFLLGDEPSYVDFDKDSIIALRDKLKKWSASYKRDTTRRRWERQEEDVSALITPETVKEFENSQATRDVVIVLGKLTGAHSMEITQAMYTLVRDYLIAQIMIDNANRAGVVAFMTVEEFKRAQMEDDRYVVKVLHHKTVDTHGPAQVVLTSHLYNCLGIFLREMRSRLPGAQMEGKQEMFLSWAGKSLQSSQITKALGSIFKKAGVEGPIHHTLYRKSAVTRCHDKHKEISSHLADLMAHRETTAEKYYRIFDKTKSSVKASQTLHGIMRDSSQEKEKQETVENSDEMNDHPVHEESALKDESTTLTRSPWNENSVTALKALFEEEISTQEITMACVREKIKNHPILNQEDPKRVYDKIRAEWRFKAKIDNKSNEDEVNLPEDEEDLDHRVQRLFAASNQKIPESSSLTTGDVSVTESTVRSKEVFSSAQAKALVDIFKDMVNDGRPISKPVIIERLSGNDVLKGYNVEQIVNRLKYERKQKRKPHKF